MLLGNVMRKNKHHMLRSSLHNQSLIQEHKGFQNSSQFIHDIIHDSWIVSMSSSVMTYN